MAQYHGHTATRAPYRQLHWVGLSEQTSFIKMGFKCVHSEAEL